MPYYPPNNGGGGGGGAVDSVNAKTGEVVLTASDVNALPSNDWFYSQLDDLGTGESNRFNRDVSGFLMTQSLETESEGRYQKTELNSYSGATLESYDYGRESHARINAAGTDKNASIMVQEYDSDTSTYIQTLLEVKPDGATIKNYDGSPFMAEDSDHVVTLRRLEMFRDEFYESTITDETSYSTVISSMDLFHVEKSSSQYEFGLPVGEGEVSQLTVSPEFGTSLSFYSVYDSDDSFTNTDIKANDAGVYLTFNRNDTSMFDIALSDLGIEAMDYSSGSKSPFMASAPEHVVTQAKLLEVIATLESRIEDLENLAG